MPDDRVARPHSTRIPVRWSDVDRRGHVNDSTYLDYAQEARHRWFRDAMAAAGLPLPRVRSVTVDFLRPILPGTAEVIVDTAITGLGTTSYSMQQTIRTSPTDIVAEVATVLVLMDTAGRHPTQVTDSARRMLMAYAAPELTRGAGGEDAPGERD
ncbi:acyl-CoA thioesterase [Corynebacterium sphenisci]|uniref:acyl-CoA thioesterase n=1 Tax=Corynebacterium sphenisci TaxID=191493 RepID=UPI0026DF3CBC|nr:acyl-CoA thioesterase [Corynebacterium sphenisci]MDO5730293.1 acyl-CoA thioesterase [Corynebacterium sphenisci]